MIDCCFESRVAERPPTELDQLGKTSYLRLLFSTEGMYVTQQPLNALYILREVLPITDIGLVLEYVMR